MSDIEEHLAREVMGMGGIPQYITMRDTSFKPIGRKLVLKIGDRTVYGWNPLTSIADAMELLRTWRDGDPEKREWLVMSGRMGFDAAKNKPKVLIYEADDGEDEDDAEYYITDADVRAAICRALGQATGFQEAA